MTAKTIDEVLTRLQSIIDTSITTNDRAGYFAALYYKVTYSVKQGIASNQFENGPRMAALDVAFANRYLTAYDLWKKGSPCTASWAVAFKAITESSHLVLQHLLLGMNAHINLDLGIAVTEVANGKDLQGIHNDFNVINTIISALSYQVIAELNRISPLLSLMGLHATNNNSVLIQFSIDNARDGAWCFAEDLSGRSGDGYGKCIADRDASIAKLAGSIVQSKGVLRFTLWLIHIFEWKKPAKVIRVLHEAQKTYFTAAKL